MTADKQFVLKWYNKLLFKMPLVFLLLFAVLVASIVLVMKRVGKVRLEQQAYRLVTQTGNTIVADVYSRTVFAESLAKSLANLGELLPLDVETYMTTVPNVMNVAGSESFIAGGGIWPEPYMFSGDIARRSFFWGRDEKGELRYYDNYNDPNGAGYHNEEWYVPAKHIGDDKDFWSKSYMDPYSYQPMVTCTVPMYRNGKFFGVSTVDFKLEGLGKFLEQASSRLGGYSFVVDRNGKFLSFPKESMAKIYPIDKFGKKTEEFIDAEQMAQTNPLFKPIADAISQVNSEIIIKAVQTDKNKSSEELVTAIDSESYQINHQEAVMISAALADPLNNMNNNYQLKQFAMSNDVLLGKPCTVFIFHVPHTYWKVVTVMPISEAIAASVSIYRTILSFIIGITAAVILAGFIILYGAFIKPLLSMSKQLQGTVEANADTLEHLARAGEDELGLLAYWFNLRSDQLADTLAKLHAARNNLEKRVEQRTGELTDVNQRLEYEITERKRAEEEIKKSRANLMKMIDAMPFGVAVIDKNKIIRLVNDKVVEMTGHSDRSDIVGKICHKLVCQTCKGDCPILDKHQQVDQSERVLLTKDGRKIPILKSVIPITFDNEEVLLEAFIDISKSKQAEEEMNRLNENLAKSNSDLKDFVYIASHDLREPMRKISAFGNLLQNSLKGTLASDDAENLSFMIEGAGRMTKMVEGLLAYSAILTKELPLGTVKLDSLIDRLKNIELADALAKSGAIIDVPKPLPVIDADNLFVRQLMYHLIFNGIKYQAKGNVPHIKIEITDNGIGIKPEFHQAIFTMFKRLHLRSEYDGIGIGLPICKKIVERYGGKIGVESQPGNGSTFWFTLPTADKTEPALLQKLGSEI
ncbi:MAG: hypothetical protein A2Y13_06940 [Planctomycetes bacterium GWC2_45_44]|nr:MAG: hypothetical protein A2Y13_06940 [Planctomycetes bacterium GWC2_45_44]